MGNKLRLPLVKCQPIDSEACLSPFLVAIAEISLTFWSLLTRVFTVRLIFLHLSVTKELFPELDTCLTLKNINFIIISVTEGFK